MPAGIRRLWPSFQSHTQRKENGDQELCNYKQPYNNLSVSSMKLEKIHCYSESINVHFRPSKRMVHELSIFFACIMTLKKAETCLPTTSNLENHMLSAS